MSISIFTCKCHIKYQKKVIKYNNYRISFDDVCRDGHNKCANETYMRM